jgi:2-polyprenyl-6-methoxyphenol hydroxylase-like FAD-dependent oxidoreductase
MALHVLIAGGGLGGLCLAQGLRKQGVSVAVYERECGKARSIRGFGRAMFKTVLRIVDGVPPLKLKMFGARPATE